ncbi:hypothetical protein PRIPAC_94757 [Pristionchus pacificus]|uniref:Acyltransferase n=1 Tax=Pristionchus pacificus TaxID=54126 RepID=A0A2A6BPT3_PRIPA|nr:hypothetical protein PRIPAC_94757 [Pristionchus pacificus]|eukprot:PDM67929.1 Acyltransferase [Pristionchus pacificus]
MRLSIFWLLLPLATAQIPFNILNMLNIPPSITGPLFKTYFEITKMETACFKDLKQAYTDGLLAGLTAMRCRSLECLRDEKITNATYAMKMLASIGRPHSLAMDELGVTYAGDPRLCRTIKASFPEASVNSSPEYYPRVLRCNGGLTLQGPFPTKYCFAHFSVDYKRINIESYGIDATLLSPGRSHSGHSRSLDEWHRGMHEDGSDEWACGVDLGRILHEATNGTATLCDISCEGPRVEEKSVFFYFFNTMLIALLCIALLASALDYWATNASREAELKGNNMRKIFLKDPNAIQCLDAIRCISFTWVASLHSNLCSADGDNSLQYIREADYLFSDIFLNSYTSVDTFFLISGLLVSFSFFKRMHKNPEEAYDRSKWIKHYVHRWIRLTPAYMLFIAFYIAWTPRMHGVWAAGTIQARNSTAFIENCEKTWWMNALYVNNINSVVDMCYGVSWFLAVDMQLYWIAPIFLIAIFYSWRTGLISILSGIFLSMFTIVFLTAYYDLPSLPIIAKDPGNLQYTDLIYMKPWTRCIPYLTGILCGYLIVQVREKTFVLRKPQTWMILVSWLIAAALALTVVFAVYDYVRGASDWSIATRALYGCFARIGWSVAIGWVILACTFGWAGPVSTILSHPLWYPLGRLSYCMFLTHWFLIHLLLDGDDRPAHFVSLSHTYLTVTVPVVFLSFIAAYMWSCLVEIPFGNIEGIVMDKLSRRPNIHDKSTEPRMAEAAWRNGIDAGSKHNDASVITTIEVNNQRAH